MSLDIDAGIFIGFLLINLVLGLLYSGGVKNIKDYATGGRQFTTAAISATIAATFIGGGSFSIWTSGVYKAGLYYMFLGLCDVLTFYLICYIVAPRCGEFLGKISIAEAIGEIYGTNARRITAIAGLFRTAGAIAMQFKVGAVVLAYAFGSMGDKLMIVAALIVITYSAAGGIRAVIMTDIMQLLTFSVFIPILAFIIWNNLDSPSSVITTLSTNPLFDYKKVFNFNSSLEVLNFGLIALVFLLPMIDPAMFQRITIAKNIKQVKNAFFWAGFCVFLITILTYWIAILLITEAPELDPDLLVPHLLQNYTYSGLRGLILAGIMAILISTADSHLNSASVLFSHDLVKLSGVNYSPKTELIVSRIALLIVGVVAIILAISVKDMLELILFVSSFYGPVVTVPFYLSIFGFRSSFKSILSGMIAGIATSTLFHFIKTSIDPTIPAILINIFVVFSYHYLFKQPGGWVGVKDKGLFENFKIERKRKTRLFIHSIRNFNLIDFLKSNTPKQESIYFSFGLFSIASVFFIMYSIPKNIHYEYAWLSSFILNSVLSFAAIFLSYPAWPKRFRSASVISIIWNFGLVYVMIFSTSLLVIMSKFSQLPMMICMINLLITAALIRWQTILLMMSLGIYSAVVFFKWQTGIAILQGSETGLQFKLIYSLLLVTGAMVMFLKPKQQYQELTEEKNEHLNDLIVNKEKEAQEALALKAEFIRNITHEYHAPMTGIISMAETLQENYDKLNDQQKKDALDVIVKSSHSLKALDDNLVTLARLNKPNYKLNKREIDISSLVYDQVQICRKLYEENNDNREFILNIKEGIKLRADKKYMIQLIDNLILNAIKYCENGQITASLSQSRDYIKIMISDSGIGIPIRELYEIFEPFTVSSKTKSMAGGRGVGLAICKRIAEVHGGTITAKSDGEKGASFIVKFPRNK